MINLPPELIEQILKYLSIKQVNVCYLTDPLFHVLTDSYILENVSITSRNIHGFVESNPYLVYALLEKCNEMWEKKRDDNLRNLKEQIEPGSYLGYLRVTFLMCCDCKKFYFFDPNNMMITSCGDCDRVLCDECIDSGSTEIMPIEDHICMNDKCCAIEEPLCYECIENYYNLCESCNEFFCINPYDFEENEIKICLECNPRQN